MIGTNHFLTPGIMPKALKEAVIHRLPKQPSLSLEELNNYLPVSNLFWGDKVLECAAASQL